MWVSFSSLSLEIWVKEILSYIQNYFLPLPLLESENIVIYLKFCDCFSLMVCHIIGTN